MKKVLKPGRKTMEKKSWRSAKTEATYTPAPKFTAVCPTLGTTARWAALQGQREKQRKRKFMPEATTAITVPQSHERKSGGGRNRATWAASPTR